MRMLHAAVAGLGFVGRTHLDALRRLGMPVAGLLGSTPEKGEAAALDLRVARAYRGFDDLVGDSAVEVVHICTPNNLHFAMARDALRAGKHVVCEKPLAMDTTESAELVRMASEIGKVCVVCFNQRYYPLCHEARERIRAGRLGEIWMVHGQFLQDWLMLPTDWSWRLQPYIGGAPRTAADVGSHWLDMVEWLTGMAVSELMADFATFIPKRLRPVRGMETFASKVLKAGEVEEFFVETEDAVTLLLRFDNGARGSVVLSQMCAGRKNHFCWEINGSGGSIGWNAERPNELWIGRRDAPNEVIVKDPALLSPGARAMAAYPGGHAEGYPDTFVQLFREVYDHLACGDGAARPRFPTFEDGHRQVVLCEAIQRSAVEEQWVKVQT